MFRQAELRIESLTSSVYIKVMATKRRREKLKEPPPGSVAEILHGVKVMFEAQDLKFVALREGQEASERRLRAELQSSVDALTRRMDSLDSAIRTQSELIRKNSEDIAALRRELEKTNSILVGKADESALAALEKRVAALEARLGTRA